MPYKLLRKVGNVSGLGVPKSRTGSLSDKDCQTVSVNCLRCRPGVTGFSEAVTSGRAVTLFTLVPRTTKLHSVGLSFFPRNIMILWIIF